MVGTGDINTTNIKTNSSAGTQSRDPKIALDQRASVYLTGQFIIIIIILCLA